MLRVTSAELILTASDLQQWLAVYAAGRVEESSLRLETDLVVITHRVRAEPLPTAVPVELTLAVHRVSGTVIEARVTWSNLPLLPGFLKEPALRRAFEALPGVYREGLLVLDVNEVLEQVPVSFGISAIHVTAQGVHVTLADLVAFPIDTAGLGASAATAVVPVPSAEEAQIPVHRSFYQKLRERVRKSAAARVPEWLRPVIPWVLAVPDFFVLLVRLAREERVPTEVKVLAGMVVAYFLTPIDLIPDLIPILGQVDDLTLAIFAVEQISRKVPAEVIEEAWPGEGEVLALTAEGARLFTQVLPKRTLEAIRRILRSR